MVRQTISPDKSITNGMQAMHKLYILMPGEDCGLCQSPSCRAFARRLRAKEAEPGNCPYLSTGKHSGKRREIHAVQAEGKELQANAQEHIFEAKPCTTGQAKTMIEIQLKTDSRYPFFDLSVLEENMQALGRSVPVKTSEPFGMARLEHEGKEIEVYSSGKVTVRKANSREDAIMAFNSLSKTLWASRICPSCANPVADCAAGACLECTSELCPVIDEGPKRIEWTETRKPDITLFRNAMQALGQLQEAVLEGKEIQGTLSECRKANMALLEQSPDRDAGVALILQGLCRGLERMSKTRLTPQMRGIVKETMDSFNSGNAARAVNAVKKFEMEAKLKPASQEEILEAIRVENNCRYMSRILSRSGQG